MSGGRAAWLALALVALPARAMEVLHTDGGVVLEASGFAKSFVSSVWLQPSLVDGTRALQAVIDEVRPLVPPELASQVPADVRLPSHVLLSAQVARVAAKARYRELVSVDVAWQLTASLVSDAKFAAGSSLAGTIGGASSLAGAQRRLVDFEPVLATSGGLRVEHQLDRLNVRVALPFGDLTLGRQVLSWGSGRVWNPTDVLSPFPPTVVDREVRRGFDAARLALALGPTTQLDLLYLPQRRAADNGGVARFQTNVAGWDGAVSFGKYVSDLLVGLDVVGDVGPVSVHGEAAYTIALSGLGVAGEQVRVNEHFLRAVVGAEWRPHEKVLLGAEYHYNGFGALTPADYLSKLSSARVTRGEVFGAGRHAAAVMAVWQAHELAALSLVTLANLQDPSVLFIPSLEWSFAQSVLVRAGANLPVGARPDADVFKRLGAADVVFQSDAFTTATKTLGLRSEHGTSPWAAFVQVGLYVP
ncbi:MAG: hypothetical protein JNJ54_33045 [Myxococcaceae bacterium]|nr:hypothetical protein [Myxococcaceae bacterium]